MKHSVLAWVLLAAIPLTACEMSAPSQINTSPIEVHKSAYHQMVKLSELNDRALQNLADLHLNRGEGPLMLTLTHDSAKKDTAARAAGQKLVDSLHRLGVRSVEVDTLPVSDPGQVGLVMIDFVEVVAQGPAACGLGHSAELRDSINENENGLLEDHRFGCGIDNFVAAQVARPKDLAGQSDMQAAGADRYGKTLQGYRKGEEFKDLKEGYASELKL